MGNIPPRSIETETPHRTLIDILSFIAKNIQKIGIMQVRKPRIKSLFFNIKFSNRLLATEIFERVSNLISRFAIKKRRNHKITQKRNLKSLLFPRNTKTTADIKQRERIMISWFQMGIEDLLKFFSTNRDKEGVLLNKHSFCHQEQPLLLLYSVHLFLSLLAYSVNKVESHTVDCFHLSEQLL